MAKACACQASAKTGPFASRGRSGRRSSASVSVIRRSRRIEIIVPEIDIEHVTRWRVRSPQLARREADAIDVLRLLAGERGIAVGKNEDAVVAVDDAMPAADIARDARMAGRMHVARDDLVAGLELRRQRDIALGGAAFADQPVRELDGEGGHQGVSAACFVSA